ncbi:hypothetical protein [Pseudactinotalea suaedae]|uniref:hypothetical protein n=1 Tax=Pseudactinotalea suaedae TaxID=1524924 RepID=UPI0012E1DDC9|nr:hypothetical protein [Pseudactinotalea suaedae]
MAEWIRFALALPVMTLLLGYLLPAVRYRRQIRADAEISAALPDGADKNWYMDRVIETAYQLRRYREDFVSSPMYWVAGLGTVLWVLATVAAVIWPPWTSPSLGVGDYLIAGTAWLTGLVSTIYFVRGRDPDGFTPDARKEYDEALLKRAVEESVRRRRKGRRARRRDR